MRAHCRDFAINSSWISNSNAGAVQHACETGGVPAAGLVSIAALPVSLQSVINQYSRQNCFMWAKSHFISSTVMSGALASLSSTLTLFTIGELSVHRGRLWPTSSSWTPRHTIAVLCQEARTQCFGFGSLFFSLIFF